MGRSGEGRIEGLEIACSHGMAMMGETGLDVYSQLSKA
jgi:hypothetical protein